MSFRATLDGGAELERDMAGILESVRARLKPGVEASAALIEAEAKLQVPVKEGTLRDAIHTEIEEETPTRVSALVAPAVQAGNEYGFTPAYARRIELGFIGADRLGRVYNQPANPFMRRAGDIQGDAAAEGLRDELAAGVSR